MLVFGANIANNFPKGVLIALGTVWTDELATRRIELCAATQAKVAVGVRLAGIAGHIFFAPG